ncbi:MAG: hypothetical protein LBR06_02425, partial [Bacteroidales bacterium]|nr:hypothetical protein [Bacteroidales bacterium]
MKFFNTTGPCFPEDHYMLPPERRLSGAQLHRYIKDKLYWVLHAPRQTGKTTFLINWMHEMNAGGQVVACYVSVEQCQGIPEIVRSMPSVCAAIRQYAEAYKLPTPDMPTSAPGDMLSVIMIDWSQKVAPKPLVVLFDEVDTLEGETMVSFLRQLRGGFASRGVGEFPVSIALVGMRDLRDYITQSKDGVSPNPGSPFNIKEDSAVINNFTESDIAELFAQRTAETGQQITQDALDYVWEQSGGQPWIVNNLFKRATMRILDVESTETVSLTHVEQARKQMIEARETHLDALAYRMQDKRVRTVIETILTGETNTNLMLDDPGVQLTLDLGLVV